MAGWFVSRRLRRWTGLVLGLFVVFLVTSELEHHDIACHLKNPQHCTACASSVVGSDPQAAVPVHSTILADAGQATAGLILLTGTVLPARHSGRSPPHA